MDSRAKQRLTGAVILVALFVLLVPELLTGPRETPAPAGEGSEAGLRQYTIDLDTQARAPATPVAPETSSVTLPPPVATPMSSQPQLAQPGEAASPENSAVPTTNPMAPSPAPSHATTSAPRPVTPSSAPATPVEPRKETPPSNQRAVPGTFVVQLGAFGTRENADRLARDMTARGFAAFVIPTTTNGRNLHLVRVGPVRDRAAAEALAAQLKRAGQTGTVVSIP